jgi:sulfur-carrier protein adenylyltransferase/sulfurtransferase
MIQGDLFPAGENISPAAVKKYIAEHEPGNYQLLDVRQPGEFTESHLPGAVLIPVKELQDRLSEVDRHKPTFIY